MNYTKWQSRMYVYTVPCSCRYIDVWKHAHQLEAVPYFVAYLWSGQNPEQYFQKCISKKFAELNHNPSLARRKTLTSGLHTSDFKHPHVSDFLFAGVVDSVNVRFQLKLVEERERQRGLESRRSSSQFGHGNTLYFICFFFRAVSRNFLAKR